MIVKITRLKNSVELLKHKIVIVTDIHVNYINLNLSMTDNSFVQVTNIFVFYFNS